MRRLLVAGSRTFEAWPLGRVADLLSQASYCLDRTFDIIIHGNARGVDQMAGAWATAKGYPLEVYPAKWDEYGRSAGYRRNAEMVAIADAAIVIWDGGSAGTRHTINLLTQREVPYVLVVRKP